MSMANTIRALLPDGTLPTATEQQVRDLIQTEAPAPDLSAYPTTAQVEGMIADAAPAGAGVRIVAGTVALTTADPALVEVYATEAAVVAEEPLFPGDAAVFRYFDGAWDVRIVDIDSSWRRAGSPVTPPGDATYVTPAAPTFTDNTETGGGSWSTPTMEGVMYSPASGTAEPEQSVTVVARAQAGYGLLGDTSWTHAFPADPRVPAEPPVRSEIEAAILADAPIMYAPLQGATVEDLGSGAATFTVQGAPNTAATMLDGSPAWEFATADYLANGATIVSSPAFTIEAVGQTSQADSGYLVASASSARREPYIGTSNVGLGADSPYIMQAVPRDGSVFHLAATWDGTTFRRYVNGAEAGTSTPTGDATQRITMNIAASFDGTRSFVGHLRDAAVYDKALTPARILAHAQAHKVA